MPEACPRFPQRQHSWQYPQPHCSSSVSLQALPVSPAPSRFCYGQGFVNLNAVLQYHSELKTIMLSQWTLQPKTDARLACPWRFSHKVCLMKVRTLKAVSPKQWARLRDDRIWSSLFYSALPCISRIFAETLASKYMSFVPGLNLANLVCYPTQQVCKKTDQSSIDTVCILA